MNKPMIRSLLLTLFALLAFCRTQAQGIGPTRLQYVNPGVSSDLELISEIMIPSQPAFRINHLSRIGADTLYLEACYYSGIMGATTTITDSIRLGTVPPGITTLHFRIFTSLSNTQCNILNSATKIQAFTLAGPTGIKPDLETVQARIYPNPANDLLVLEGAGWHSIRLRDLTGKLIRTMNFPENRPLRIAVDTLPNGTYLAEFVSCDGKLVTRKFLKH